jgi:hypothetical protein
MATAMQTDGSFDMGRVVSRLFTVLGRHFVPFFVCALVFAGLPAAALGWWQVSGAANPAADLTGSLGLGLASFAVTLVGGSLLQAAVIHGTISDLNGKPVSIGDGLQAGLRLLLPLIGIAIVVGLLTGLATILLVVPGVMVAMVYAVAIPAEVVERRGISESMSRSAALTRNHRWAIFALAAAYLIGAVIVGAAIGAVTGAFGGAANIPFLKVQALLITPIVQSVTTLVAAAGTASIYYELRYIKDGVGLETIASVFD